MNLEQVLERLLYLRDKGYVPDSAEVVVRTKSGDPLVIEEIDTEGAEVEVWT